MKILVRIMAIIIRWMTNMMVIMTMMKMIRIVTMVNTRIRTIRGTS